MSEYYFKSTRIERRTTYEINSAEPITLPFRKTLIRPDKYIVRSAEGGRIMSRTIVGPNVKKDGTDGQNVHEMSLYTYESDGWPAWVAEIDAAHVASYGTDR